MQWKKMNTDLSKLNEFIQEFFEKKEFQVAADKLGDEYRITANPRQFHGILDSIVITINGNSNDFTVKMTTETKSRSYVMLGNLLSFLGFGFLAIKGHQSEENLEKLEKGLRIFLAEKVSLASHVAS